MSDESTVAENLTVDQNAEEIEVVDKITLNLAHVKVAFDLLHVYFLGLEFSGWFFYIRKRKKHLL